MTGIDFSAADWERIKETYQAWWDHELDRPLVYFTGVFESGRAPAVEGHSGFLSNYGLETPVERILDNYLATQAGRRFPGDSFPFWFINFGAGVLAEPLGAKLHSTSDTVWFEPPEGADLGELEISLDSESPWWRRVLEVTRAAAERFGETVQVSHTDLGGNLDILASLVGSERLMMELIDRPELVDEACARVTECWIEAFDELDALYRSQTRYDDKQVVTTSQTGPKWAQHRQRHHRRCRQANHNVPVQERPQPPRAVGNS